MDSVSERLLRSALKDDTCVGGHGRASPCWGYCWFWVGRLFVGMRGHCACRIAVRGQVGSNGVRKEQIRRENSCE
jgi:hypothetical protein